MRALRKNCWFIHRSRPICFVSLFFPAFFVLKLQDYDRYSSIETLKWLLQAPGMPLFPMTLRDQVILSNYFFFVWPFPKISVTEYWHHLDTWLDLWTAYINYSTRQFTLSNTVHFFLEYFASFLSFSFFFNSLSLNIPISFIKVPTPLMPWWSKNSLVFQFFCC